MFDDSRNNFNIGLYSVDKLWFTASDMDSKRISTLEFLSAGGVALVLNPGKDERPKKVDTKMKHKEVIDPCTL